MRFDQDRFFTEYREQVAGQHLEQVEIDHLLNILTNAEDDERVSVRQLGYMIATARWETARFKRMREVGPRSYFNQYENKGGNRKPGDGYKYRGNGYCHTTFYANHLRTQRELAKAGIQLDLVNDPDQLWKIGQANYEAMLRGHLEGWFTTFKLGQFVNEQLADYRSARLVINPGELYIADGKWKAKPARRQQCVEAVATIVQWAKGCESALRDAVEEKVTAIPAPTPVVTETAVVVSPAEIPAEAAEPLIEPKPEPNALGPQFIETAKLYSPKLAQAGFVSTILSTVTAWISTNRWITAVIIALLLVAVGWMFRKTLRNVFKGVGGGL